MATALLCGYFRYDPERGEKAVMFRTLILWLFFLSNALAATQSISVTDQCNQVDAGHSLINDSRKLRENGDYENALSTARRALEVAEQLGPEHPDTARALNNLASIYRIQGKYFEAEPLYFRAITIREKICGADHPQTAESLNSLAALYKDTGEYSKASELFKRALTIRQKVFGENNPDTATTINNLAGIYEAMNAYGLAIPLYESALSIFERIRGTEHQDTARSLNNLAWAYVAIGEHQKAKDLYLRSLAIIEKVYGLEHRDYARGLNNLAYVLQVEAKYTEAIALYQRSLKIREQELGAYHPSIAISLCNLAGLYAIVGEDAKAEALYGRAMTILADNKSPETLWRVQDGLSRLAEKKNRKAEAIFFGKLAVNTIQSIRGKLGNLDKDIQVSFLDNKSYVFRHLSEQLIEAGRLAESQQVMAMLKEEEYFEFVQRDSKEEGLDQRATLSGAEAPWARRYGEISGKLAGIGRELGELRKKQDLSKSEQSRLSALEKDLEVANQNFDQMVSQLIAGLANSQAVSDKVDDIGARQGTLDELGAGTVLLQYLVLDNKVSMLLTTPAVRLARESKVTRAELNHLIAAYRETLHNPRLDPQPQAQALYQLLIAPVSADLEQAQAKVIMLSLDGTLRYLPFAALNDGQHYLVERYAISLYNEAAADKLKDKNAATWKVWGLGVTQAHPGFKALSAVKGELNGIVGQAGLSGQTLLDDAFNEQALKDGVSQHYPVLHIASHFKFTPGTLSDSYLLLGDDTHLSLRDVKIKHSFIGVDLVTLSACETGFGGGQDANGREVEGLGAIMQKKGAKSVMATLWPVADASTAQLMQSFYHERQQQHLSKAEALRQAQLALLTGRNKTLASVAPDERGFKRVQQDGTTATASAYTFDPKAPYAHPFFWAPFILMGNWL